MHIYLPNSAHLGNIDAFLKRLEFEDPSQLIVTPHPEWFSVHPVVLSMIAALGLTTPKHVTFEQTGAKSRHYLDRMGLLRMLGRPASYTITEHESTGRFIPLSQIKNSHELSRFIAEMVPLLHLEPRHAEPIMYIISELVRNVLEHARSSDGAIVCAQYYKKTNRISLGIADRGVGIRSSINRSYRAENSLEAIKLALTPGVTGTTRREGGTEQNAGAGLFFTKSIAAVNKNFFVMYSGDAMFKLLKSSAGASKTLLHVNPFDDRHSRREDLPFWDGTVVGIDISLDTSQEFSLLLDLVRSTYAQAVRERKKARYRQASFI